MIPTPPIIILEIPQNFDASILSEGLGRSDMRRNLEDAMYYILHALIEMEDRKDMQHKYDIRGFYPLHTDILKPICGSRYTLARSLLQTAGVIQVDDDFLPGAFSIGYRITEAYSGDTHNISLSPLSYVYKNILKYNTEKKAENRKALRPIAYVTKWLDGDRLKLDAHLIHNYIEFYNRELIRLLSSSKLPAKHHARVLSKITRRYNNSIRTAQRIMAGDFNPTRTGEDHRLHTTITGLQSELRTLLTFDGEELISLDITASQPYLFTHLLNKSTYAYKKGRATIRGVYPELYNTIRNQPDTLAGIYNTIMSLTYPEGCENESVIPTNFSQVNWLEDFYTLLKDLEQSRFPLEHIFQDRRVTKYQVMLILYEKRNYKYNTPWYQTFADMFPIEGRLIQIFDALGSENYLPILLQRIESKVMLDLICKKISQEFPDAPLITIHDSILTTPKYCKQVHRIMTDGFNEVIGLRPGIKMKTYSHEQTIAELKEQAVVDLERLIDDSKNTRTSITPKKKQPLLHKIPKLNGSQILSTRYVDPDENIDNNVAL